MFAPKTKPPAAGRGAQSDFHHLIASTPPCSGKCCSRTDALGVLMTVGLGWAMMLLIRIIIAN